MRYLKRGWATVLVACLMATKVIAADGEDADIPMDLIAGHLVVVRGAIGSVRRVTFLIDTGTNRSLVDRDTAARLRLEAIGEATLEGSFARAQVPRVMGRSVRLGALEIDALPLLAADLSVLSASGTRIDAVLGLDVLRRGRLTIDYARRRVRFGSTEASACSAELATVSPALIVVVEVGGRRARLMVDTGAPRTLLYSDPDGPRLPIARVLGMRNARGFGGDALVHDVEIGPLRLGTTEWDRVAGLLATAAETPPDGTDGVLAPASLSLRSVDFDFEHRRLGWRR